MKKALFLIITFALFTTIISVNADERFGGMNRGDNPFGNNSEMGARPGKEDSRKDTVAARTLEYYKNLDETGVNFITKLQTCSKAKNPKSKEAIYGKTKNGRCHYSYKKLEQGEYVEHHCIIPLKTALGYSTTAQDVIDYSESYPEIAAERLKQNNEIGKIILDYCVAK